MGYNRRAQATERTNYIYYLFYSQSLLCFSAYPLSHLESGWEHQILVTSPLVLMRMSTNEDRTNLTSNFNSLASLKKISSSHQRKILSLVCLKS